MADLDKTIRGLACCLNGNNCKECPYKELFSVACIDAKDQDALELLKEQQETIERQKNEYEKLYSQWLHEGRY